MRCRTVTLLLSPVVALTLLGCGCWSRGTPPEPEARAVEEARPTPASPWLLEQKPLGTWTDEDILSVVPGTGDLFATFGTRLGEVRCLLHADRAPATVASFVGLALGLKAWVDPDSGRSRSGAFYEGTVLHRVLPGRFIQGGDRSGTGAGRTGFTRPDEFHPELRHDRAGTLSMSTAGPNTAGGQFFITLAPFPQFDDRYPVFGHCGDLEVLERIASVPTDGFGRPIEPLTIDALKVQRRGGATLRR
jgi:peptidyl-prolyl cis-trans isomerase A (cyclophilin A)